MRKKRFLSWFLTLCLLLGMFSFPAYAEGSTTMISGDGTADKTGTMTITLVIPKKTPTATDLTYTAPSDLTYSGSDKTATVVAKSDVTGMGDITVKYFSDAARSTEVTETKNVGTYYVGVTVAEGDGYVASTTVLYSDGWTFTITASTPSAPAAPTKASATKNSITLNAVSGCEYSKDGSNWQSGTEFTGLQPGTEYTFYQRIKATSNTNASAASSAKFSTEADTYAMTITLVIKSEQTITAEDVTVTYGDTDKSVSATASGAISYAVKDGSGDYIDVDATTGAMTIKKVPSDGKAYVVVTAAETSTYTSATKEVTVTINKANATPATVTANNLTYNGQDQALVTADSSTLVGGTMYYAVTTDNTAPTDESLYTTSIPTKTDAGTYYVWYKVIGDSSHADSSAACVTVKIKERSSGQSYTPTTYPSVPSTSDTTPASSTQTEAYTIPVSNENTVNISTNISDGNAVVQEITQEDLNKITQTANSGNGEDQKTEENTKISIDVSNAKSEVTSVELSDSSIEKIAKTVESSDKVDGVEIKMTNATVELDGTAVSAVSEQREGNTVKLVVENKEQAKLNETQKESLKSFSFAQPFQAYFESGGKEIHDFRGGKATVSIKFTPAAGKNAKYYHLYYIPLSGLIERYVTRYLDGMLIFVTSHFSDYAIVYDETMENETGKPEATAIPVPTAAPETTATPEPSASAMPSETEIPSASAEPTVAPTAQPSATATPAPAVTSEEKAATALDLNAGLKVIHKGKTATVQWGKVSGADFYKVYATYCGLKKFELVKKVKGTAKCKVTIKKLGGKKLDTKKNIKVYVVAYRKAEVTSGTGTATKNVRIAKTIIGHVVGKENKKYSNAKKITLSKSSYTIKKGKSVTIKATTILQYPDRKQLSDAHAKEFRYATTDKSIATVNKTGKITAKKKGSCVIYVYARNGLAEKVKVKVI